MGRRHNGFDWFAAIPEDMSGMGIDLKFDTGRFPLTGDRAKARLEFVVAALLFACPVVLLSVRSGASTCFTALVILSFYYLLVVTPGHRDRFAERTVQVYAAAMASLVLATAINELAFRNFAMGPFDGPSRFLFAFPIYLMLREMRAETVTAAQYGFPIGAILAALSVVLYQPNWTSGGRAGTYFSNAIHFGGLALILGMLSALTINWIRKDSNAMLGLKVIGLCAGVFASVQSGTRGAWISIPAVFVVLLFYYRRKISFLTGGMLTAMLIIAVLAIYFLSPGTQERVNFLVTDFYGLFQSRMDTSLGLRLQGWKAALLVFAEHPLFGVGPDAFKTFLPALRDAGIITSAAAEVGVSEVHNEILLRTVSLGIFGLVSILAIYFVPLILFVKLARTASPYRRQSAIMGVCLVVAFLIFGMTVEIFNLKMTATFYALTVAVLLAAAMGREPVQPAHV